MRCFYDLTMCNIEEYFMRESGHNTVSRNMGKSASSGFMAEIITEFRRYFMKIYVDAETECVTMEVYPGINASARYRPMTSQLCMRMNSKLKAGMLVLDPVRGDIYCRITSFFKDGPLTEVTIEAMEQIALSCLTACQDELECVSHGMPWPYKAEADELDRIISSFFP